MAILNEQEIRDLIRHVQSMVELAYMHHLEEDFGGDEYFKRGFLLACKELTESFINKLKNYEVRTMSNEIEKVNVEEQNQLIKASDEFAAKFPDFNWCLAADALKILLQFAESQCQKSKEVKND